MLDQETCLKNDKGSRDISKASIEGYMGAPPSRLVLHTTGSRTEAIRNTVDGPAPPSLVFIRQTTALELKISSILSMSLCSSSSLLTPHTHHLGADELRNDGNWCMSLCFPSSNLHYQDTMLEPKFDIARLMSSASLPLPPSANPHVHDTITPKMYTTHTCACRSLWPLYNHPPPHDTPVLKRYR
jgi:hypothetical protein